MRIAIVSDIHGNWTALDSVLHDIKRRGADQIICLGDFIDPMPSSRRVFDFLNDQKIVTLRGNHEDYVVSSYEDPSSKMNSLIQYRPVKVTRESFDAASIAQLKNLPFTHTIKSAKSGDLLLCHASPSSNTKGWRYTMTPELETELMSHSASTFVCGHWHDAETRDWNGKRLITAGSVGVPLKTRLECEYLILTEERGSWSTEHLTVPYDPTPMLMEYKNEGWLQKGGPVGWLLFYEVATANRGIMPFLRWVESRGPLPVDEKLWESYAQAYLKEVGGWDIVRSYLA